MGSRQLLRRLTLSGLLTLLVLPGVPAQDAQRYFFIASGPVDGPMFDLGTRLANAVSKPQGALPCERGGNCGVPGLIALVQSTGSSAANLAMVADGAADSGLVHGSTATAMMNGPALEDEPGYGHLRAIAYFKSEVVRILVPSDAGIERIADLRGKRVFLAELGAGASDLGQLLLDGHGLDLSDLVLTEGPSWEGVSRLRAGEVDAAIVFTPFNTKELPVDMRTDGLRTLPIDPGRAVAIARTHPFLEPTHVAFDDGARTATMDGLAIVSVWLTTIDADPELIDGMLQALWHGDVALSTSLGDVLAVPVPLVVGLRDPAIAWHPAVEAFYEARRGPTGALPVVPPQRIDADAWLHRPG